MLILVCDRSLRLRTSRYENYWRISKNAPKQTRPRGYRKRESPVTWGFGPEGLTGGKRQECERIRKTRSGSLHPIPLPRGQGRLAFRAAICRCRSPPPRSGAPRGSAGQEGSGAPLSEGRATRPPRPRPRTTAARQPGGSREEGPRPRPAPKPRRQNRNLSRGKRNAARPAPPDPARRRAAPRTGARRPPPPPAPPRPQPPRRQVATAHCLPPLACPPARPPGTRPAPPLAAAHRAEADPAGWLRRHLERATKPGPASAATRLGGGREDCTACWAHPLPGRGARPPRPPTSASGTVVRRAVGKVN
uniref:basic proline-rich protein-like n=1 Tax=Panthera onca TaxID=9690 RepID=UPI0029541DE0|nr:basic proline-rich protein-like [Panthera onca]